MNEKQSELILSPSLRVTTKRELSWNTKTPVDGKPPVTIPQGTQIEVHFSETVPTRLFLKHGDRLLRIRLADAHKAVTGIGKMPSLRTLERYSMDGVAKTPTGHRTEPDGYGPDGSPSWLLVMGVI